MSFMSSNDYTSDAKLLKPKIDRQNENKNAYNYKIPEKIKQVWSDSILTVLKPKTMPIPTSDEIYDSIETLIKDSSFSDNNSPVSLHLIIGLPKVAGGISEITEEWSLTYFPETLFNSKRSKSSPHYRSKELTLLYQSIYTFVKQMPLEKKFSTDYFNRNQVQIRLSLSQSPEGEFLDSSKIHSFTPIYLKKDKITVSVLYLDHEVTINKSIGNKTSKIKISSTNISASPRLCIRAPTPIPSYSTENASSFSRLSSSPASSRINESFVGSYEESLLSGRMSTLPSKPIEGFIAKVGILSRGRCPPHFSIAFSPSFYEHRTGNSSPYVGNIPLYPDGASEYRVPSQGQLQVVVVNPNATAVQVFLIPYDLRDMPPNTKTFLRHRIQVTKPGRAPALRQAIHVQLARFSSGEIYLYHALKVCFSLRVIDDDQATTTTSLQQPPPNLRFTSLPKIIQNSCSLISSGPILELACEEDGYLGYK